MVTYERETGDVLERFNESLNVVRVKLNINVDFHIKMLSDYNSIWKAVSLWKWPSLPFQLIFRPGDATLARFPWWPLLSSNSGWIEPEILFPAVFLFFTLSRSINTSEGVSETVQYFLDRLYTNRYQPSWNPVYVITILKEVCPIDCGLLRISIHMLISHYNALLGEAQTLTGWADFFVHRCGVLCSVHWPSMIYQAWLGQLIRPVTS